MSHCALVTVQRGTEHTRTLQWSQTLIVVQYYIHSLHKEGKLISEQSPGCLNSLLLLAIDPSQPLT